MMKRLIGIFVLSFMSFCASAAPSLFGMEFGKMDEATFKEQMESQKTGKSKFNNGNMYMISRDKIDFSGLKTPVFVVFNTDGELAGVIVGLNKSRYDKVKSMLDNKYRQISEKDPFVGNKATTYQDDNVLINIKAPHMSRTMQMEYLTQEFTTQRKNFRRQERMKKSKKESSQL